MPQLTLNELIVQASAAVARLQMATGMGQGFSGKRSYEEVFGYPSAEADIPLKTYRQWYKRGGIAKRIIDLPCEHTWRHAPEVIDDEDAHDDTGFEEGWISLNKRLKIVAEMQRADIQQSIGHYSVMLLGVKDGLPLDKPLREGGLRGPDDLLWVDVFDEEQATIDELEEKDTESPQYRLPKFYRIDMGSSFISGATAGKQRVHYSRILHFAEGCLKDRIYGTPRLEAPLNLLMDLLKVSGGGAESFWLNASSGLKVETREGYTLSPEDAAQLTEEMEQYVHQLTRFLRLQGATAERMGVATADPRGQYDITMEQLAGTAKIPRRILVGSEMGELASLQDRENMNDNTMARQNQFAEPQMLRPFLDRGVYAGFLPPPRDEYLIKWKDLKEMSLKDKAQLALARAQAASAHSPGVAEAVIAVSELRETMGLEAEMSDEAKKSNTEIPVDEADPEVQAQFEQGRQAREREAA